MLWYKTVSRSLLLLNPQVLFCYLSFSDFSKKHPYHLYNFRIEFTNLSSFFPVNSVTVFYSVFYTHMLRRGGLREKNKPKKKKTKTQLSECSRHFWKLLCCYPPVIFKWNGPDNAGFYVFIQEKNEKDWIRLTTSPLLAHGFYHLTSDDTLNLCW